MWPKLYPGVHLPSGSPSPRQRSASCSRSRSRSDSRDAKDSDIMGEIEEIKFHAESTRNDLNARLLALEQHETTLPVAPRITTTELQQATVQRFTSISTDLRNLVDHGYDIGKDHAEAMTTLKSGIAGLEASIKTLRADNAGQRKDLSALQAVVARLEIVSAPPLILRGRSPQPPADSCGTVPAHRPLHTAHHPKARAIIRPRSHSPRAEPAAKRARPTELERGFVSFGPLADSSETTVKHELHLRTAIPNFRLEAPYEVKSDPNFQYHLRVAVTSAAAARALVQAWSKNTVAGYANIKMTEMLAAFGTERARTLPIREQRDQYDRRDQGSGSRAPTTSNHSRNSESSRR
ncbi:hypothetical protein B0H17DRAFT_1241403 [Mycena rosella]|uniref:Uncharacterized protein n=1 Tax=Mycena rosella TaxID=1033263 RepID=A0AAD7D1M2_MYCRO|nr:hypothetical protein B0H17DRAFT_1241403 [Mycena rosella]